MHFSQTVHAIDAILRLEEAWELSPFTSTLYIISHPNQTTGRPEEPPIQTVKKCAKENPLKNTQSIHQTFSLKHLFHIKPQIQFQFMPFYILRQALKGIIFDFLSSQKWIYVSPVHIAHCLFYPCLHKNCLDLLFVKWGFFCCLLFLLVFIFLIIIIFLLTLCIAIFHIYLYLKILYDNKIFILPDIWRYLLCFTKFYVWWTRRRSKKMAIEPTSDEVKG